MALNKKIAAVVVVALLILAGVILARKGGLHATGSASPSNNPSSNSTFIEASDGVLSDGFLSLGLSGATGGVEGTGNITYRVSSGSCASATTTLFSVANPMTSQSTSTAMVIIRGIGQATSTALTVGTTTSAVGLTSSTVSSTLVNAATIATTTPFYIESGLTGSSTPTPAGSGTTREVVVGPSERIGAFATSSASGAGAAGYVGGLTSCTYRILWMQ